MSALPSPTAEVQIIECTRCGYRFTYPRSHCRICGCLELEHRPLEGEGHIYTLTVIHVHPDPEANAQAPFTVAYVDLDDGPRVLVAVRLDGSHPPAIGARVRVRVHDGRAEASPLGGGATTTRATPQEVNDGI